VHVHLAKVAVCWQFAAGSPELLAAEFAILAAQLGARELADPRDSVASVHAVLARQPGGWLLIFDNATGWASVQAFVPPAGPGRVPITTPEPALATQRSRRGNAQPDITNAARRGLLQTKPSVRLTRRLDPSQTGAAGDSSFGKARPGAHRCVRVHPFRGAVMPGRSSRTRAGRRN